MADFGPRFCGASHKDAPFDRDTQKYANAVSAALPTPWVMLATLETKIQYKILCLSASLTKLIKSKENIVLAVLKSPLFVSVPFQSFTSVNSTAHVHHQGPHIAKHNLYFGYEPIHNLLRLGWITVVLELGGD